MFPFGAAPGSTLGAGGAGFILMDASLPTGANLPRRLVHDFSLSYEPDLGLPAQERTGLTNIARDRAVVIGSPLKGSRWVDVNGCCAGPNSHRHAVNPINGAFYVSERFAIDFAQLTRRQTPRPRGPGAARQLPVLRGRRHLCRARCRGSNPGRHRRQRAGGQPATVLPRDRRRQLRRGRHRRRVTSRSTHICSRAASGSELAIE